VTGFEGDGAGNVRAIAVVDVDRGDGGSARGLVRRPGSERTIEADLVLLAIGFEGVRPSPLFEQLGVAIADGTIAVADDLSAAANVTAAGDAVLGAALVVNAIADGRRAAATCDLALRSAALATT
jgi:glutamate synthase (NADPH/NADH) small chain